MKALWSTETPQRLSIRGRAGGNTLRAYTGVILGCAAPPWAGSIPVRLTKLSSAVPEGAKYLKNRAVAAVRLNRFPSNAHTLRKKQLLKPLLLIQRRLDPKVRGPRQNAFCEGQDALYVEFFERLGVTSICASRRA